MAWSYWLEFVPKHSLKIFALLVHSVSSYLFCSTGHIRGLFPIAVWYSINQFFHSRKFPLLIEKFENFQAISRWDILWIRRTSQQGLRTLVDAHFFSWGPSMTISFAWPKRAISCSDWQQSVEGSSLALKKSIVLRCRNGVMNVVQTWIMQAFNVLWRLSGCSSEMVRITRHLFSYWSLCSIRRAWKDAWIAWSSK